MKEKNVKTKTPNKKALGLTTKIFIALLAGAILGTLDQQMGEEPLYYRVQTGIFRKRENADRMLYGLQDKGYPAYILQDGDFYKVQVGAFVELGNGIRMEQQLRDDGYSTLIVTR